MSTSEQDRQIELLQSIATSLKGIHTSLDSLTAAVEDVSETIEKAHEPEGDLGTHLVGTLKDLVSALHKRAQQERSHQPPQQQRQQHLTPPRRQEDHRPSPSSRHEEPVTARETFRETTFDDPTPAAEETGDTSARPQAQSPQEDQVGKERGKRRRGRGGPKNNHQDRSSGEQHQPSEPAGE